MASLIVNEGPKWIILSVYLILNASLFAYQFSYFNDSEDYYYLRKILHNALPIARATGFVLNFNCMLILLPVCRNLISFLRGKCTCCRRSVRRQLDKNLFFHKWIAYTICLLSVIHCIAHFFNGEYFVWAYTSSDKVVSALCSLPRSNDSWINPFSKPTHEKLESLYQVLQTAAGITGVLITLSLILILSSSTEFIRRSFFEVFWYSHHLCIIFFIGLLLHGYQGIVRFQDNLKSHNISNENCSHQPDNWGKLDHCDVPLFAKTETASWKWLMVPLTLYICERILRYYRSRKRIFVHRVIMHPSKVIEIQMYREGGFHAEVGQYIFLQCSAISPWEWHPFTLTSAPEDDYLGVHIRQVGDWTEKVGELFSASQNPTELPYLSVDGPFGTASEDVFKYQVSVLVASGIGVTPFASVLKSIWHKLQQAETQLKLRKVYFYWLCRDTNAFEWFADLLNTLETQLDEKGMMDFLHIRIYLTRFSSSMRDDAMLNDSERRCFITGLRTKTHFGRPRWEADFPGMSKENPEVRSIGVFFCGAKELSHTLHEMSNRYSAHNSSGTHFHYNKENF